MEKVTVGCPYLSQCKSTVLTVRIRAKELPKVASRAAIP